MAHPNEHRIRVLGVDSQARAAWHIPQDLTEAPGQVCDRIHQQAQHPSIRTSCSRQVVRHGRRNEWMASGSATRTSSSRTDRGPMRGFSPQGGVCPDRSSIGPVRSRPLPYRSGATLLIRYYDGVSHQTRVIGGQSMHLPSVVAELLVPEERARFRSATCSRNSIILALCRRSERRCGMWRISAGRGSPWRCFRQRGVEVHGRATTSLRCGPPNPEWTGFIWSPTTRRLTASAVKRLHPKRGSRVPLRTCAHRIPR